MKHLLCGLLLQLAACESCAPPPTPVPPVPIEDAGPAPIPSSTPAPVPPAPTVIVDAGPPPAPAPAPGVREACASIAAAGCAEGGSSCGRSLQTAVAKRLTAVPLACLSAARSKAAVRACGSFVACR